MKIRKFIFLIVSNLAVLALITMSAAATTYTGTGDVNGGAAADGAGIGSVVINNTASTISFTINSTQPMASYIFYAIEIQIIGAPVGNTALVNPWGPLVGISTGENALINTYGTGATALTYNGSWATGPSVSYAAGGTGASFATMTFALSDLGLNVGESFYFDVVSTYTSGTQSAYGALDNTSWPEESDIAYTPWNGTSSYDSATDAGGTIFGTAASMYTVTTVPEPATLALLGGGLILLMAQRRRVR